MRRMDLMSYDNKRKPFFFDPSQTDQTHSKCSVKLKTYLSPYVFLYLYYVNAAIK